MGSLRNLNSVCRHCGNKLLRGEVHRDRDGARVCLSCAGNETFGRESWQAYLSWKAEVDRLVDLIERWDREDVHDLQIWLTQLRIVVDDMDIGESIHNYVDLPHPSVPEGMGWVVTAIDRHGRCLSDGRILSSLDEYRPDKAEVSRLVNLIEQWDREDVRDLKDWLLELRGILAPTQNSVWDYVSISVDVPAEIEGNITAIDRHGRCLMDDFTLKPLIRLMYPEDSE